MQSLLYRESTAFKSIAGGTGLSSPSIAFDPANNKIVAVLQGEDSRLWKSTYDPDTDTWDFWTSNGEICKGRPTIAVNSSGDHHDRPSERFYILGGI